MIGSILGDIAGSTYEFTNNKDHSAELFPKSSSYTDDTVMMVATAEAILRNDHYAAAYRRYGAEYPYPMGGYGTSFARWLREDAPRPYGSWGNGAAMRVAPIGWAFESLEETLRQAEASAAVSHDHPEGIKGAQATAAAVWMARKGCSKAEIRNLITERFGYDLSRPIAAIRPTYAFDESCQGTVPEALIAFLEARDFEDALRNAISLGGDADTLACITGAVAEAHFSEIPEDLMTKAREILPAKLLAVTEAFRGRFLYSA